MTNGQVKITNATSSTEGYKYLISSILSTFLLIFNASESRVHLAVGVGQAATVTRLLLPATFWLDQESASNISSQTASQSWILHLAFSPIYLASIFLSMYTQE